MNPFERKVCHDVVASAGLVSESEGAEPCRYVVVLPAARWMTSTTSDQAGVDVDAESADDQAEQQVGDELVVERS